MSDRGPAECRISKTVAYEAIDTPAVELSANLWDELGDNTYDSPDLISELIDNGLAARIEDELLLHTPYYPGCTRIRHPRLTHTGPASPTVV